MQNVLTYLHYTVGDKEVTERTARFGRDHSAPKAHYPRDYTPPSIKITIRNQIVTQIGMQLVDLIERAEKEGITITVENRSDSSRMGGTYHHATVRPDYEAAREFMDYVPLPLREKTE